MQIDVNIESIVAEAIAASLAPEKLQPIIQKSIDQVVKDAIEGQFAYRSPFKKMLEEKMAGVMPTDIENIGRYGDLVMKTVTAMLGDSQNQAVNQTIKDKLSSLLKPLPERMKLSDLLAKLTQEFENSYDRNGSDQPTFIIEKNEGVTAGYWHLYADVRQDMDKYRCKVHMYFNSTGECYSLKINDLDPAKGLFLGSAYNVDAIVLNLYTGGVKIDFEEIYTEEIYYSDRCD